MIGPIADFPHLLNQLSGHMHPLRHDIPHLNGIYFEATGTHLYAVATDRHTLAVVKRPLEAGPEREWEAFVTADALKSVRAFVRLNRREPIYLDYVRGMYDDVLSVTAGRQTLAVPTLDDQELGSPWRSDNPKWLWRNVLTDALAGAPDLRQEAHFSPRLLARWGTAGGAVGHEPLTVWAAGPNRPLVIACGTDFIGLHMPIRVDGSIVHPLKSIRADWADLAPAASRDQHAA
ncbi:hypothetical protein [Streptomyces sp. NBC_01465]|uniref:hypothetical protein n=1 Tax=Streptomyces sp. NBC_01465 TaxID=2903878 RepID=UPI002E36D29E|nr:hypothetical protein [Streptomyces sp. NBC_01465]